MQRQSITEAETRLAHLRGMEADDANDVRRALELNLSKEERSERWIKRWGKSPDLRQEYQFVEDYVAYMNALSAGRIKFHGRGRHKGD